MTTLQLSTHEVIIQYIKIILGVITLLLLSFYMYKSISFYNHFEQVYNQCVQSGR